MLLHMVAATSATASAPREPVNAAVASAPDGPQQHTAGRSRRPSDTSVQPTSRDSGTKDDRPHGGAEVGEHRLAGTGEPTAEAMGQQGCRQTGWRGAAGGAISIQCAATNCQKRRGDQKGRRRWPPPPRR